MTRELPNLNAWDGYSWRSSIALIAVYLLDGLIVLPLSLFLGVWLAIGNSEFLDVAMTTNLFLAGLFTMAFVSIRQQSREAQRLRWTAITLNGILIGMGAMGWAAHLNSTSRELFPFDALAMIGIGMFNLACIAMSRQFFGGRACQSCGYDLRSLRSGGCPECGWMRESG